MLNNKQLNLKMGKELKYTILSLSPSMYVYIYIYTQMLLSKSKKYTTSIVIREM